MGTVFLTPRYTVLAEVSSCILYCCGFLFFFKEKQLRLSSCHHHAFNWHLPQIFELLSQLSVMSLQSVFCWIGHFLKVQDEEYSFKDAFCILFFSKWMFLNGRGGGFVMAQILANRYHAQQTFIQTGACKISILWAQSWIRNCTSVYCVVNAIVKVSDRLPIFFPTQYSTYGFTSQLTTYHNTLES